MEQKHVLLVVAGGVVAVFGYYYTPWLLYPLFLVMSVACGAAFALLRGGYELRRVQTQPKPPVTRTFAVLSRLKVYPAPTLRPTLLSANVDSHIQGVLELVLKHHVIPTYNIVAADHKAYFNTLIPELWNVLHILLNRVSHVDTIKLVSQDVVEAMRKHFVPFRGFQVNNPLPPGVTLFPDISQFPYLVSPEKEREFLQKAVDVLLCACLPNEYLKCAPVRVIIREYLVSNIVQPTIDRVCEPDYINRKILAYLVRKEENTSVEKKYAYSDYEEFMTYLQKCEDVTELSQIRQSIIMDIMQAKAVQHMRETSTGLRMAQLPVTIPAEKAKMLMERDLSLYINQLNTAKNKCERRIRKLGGELHQQQLAQSVESDRIIQDFPLPIPFDSIMHNETAFMYFVKYLDQYGYSSLPLFWKAVQNLRETPPHDIIHRLHSVYTEYLCQGATNPIHTDFETVQEIEKTLSHTELCLAAMKKLQDSVYTELHQQFYTSFLHSQSFKEFMDCEAEQESGALFHQKVGSQAASPSLEETSYQKRLKFLQQRVSQKEAAIAAMPPSATKRREKLMRDKAVLEEEIKRVVHYIGHTEEWFGTVGQWVVEVSSVDLHEDDNSSEKNPIFIVVVHRPESSQVEHLRLNPQDVTQSITGSARVRNISDSGSDTDGVIALQDSDDVAVPKNAGWVIGRHLSEFQELHKKVTVFWPDLVFPQVPKKLLLFQRKETEMKYWKKFCHSIESYMNTILQDPKMQESEEVFNFLSPASAELRQSSATHEEKSAKVLSLSTLPTLFDTKSEESILDHFSALITEVFELQDRSRILRRQLYDLVQLTYGGSIDKELQDFATWVLSEPMLIYYLETFKESLWPNGEPAPPPPVRSDEDKQKTREETKQRFVGAVPPNLQTILGHRDCKIGFLKIFAALQDRHANKQLFYSLLELFLYALVPELESVRNEEV